MTEGTSQGLFVVVAIVIFGIFVGLAYTAFAGEYGLQPQMVNLFNQVLENTNYKNYTLSDNLIVGHEEYVEPWFSTGGQDEESLFYVSDGVYTIEPNKEFHGGLRLDQSLVEANKHYKLSFEITKESGQLLALGGHMWLADETEVYLDGQRVFYHNNVIEPVPNDNVWSSKVHYPDDLEKHKVEILFDTNLLDDPILGDYFNRGIFIQPNRQFYHKSKEHFRIKIENLILQEITLIQDEV